jgi:hypothetical protein
MRNSTQNFWRFKKPFFEMSKAIPVSIWNEFTSKNVAIEALDRSRLILNTDHWFSSKSCQNMIFLNVKAIPVSFWNDFTPNVATEALDRSSWILDADHSVQSHVKFVFLKCKKLFLYLFEMNSLPKTWLQRY